MLPPLSDRDAGEAAVQPLADGPPLTRTVALVGIMGAGKSAVGRRLAKALDVPFTDADDEIVASASMSIPDIFASHGEARFRDLERRVIARVLEGPPVVLALGGGAFIDPQTRAAVKRSALSVWLRADLETLLARTGRKKNTRPLLMHGDPREILSELIARRYPIYAEADRVVDTAEQGAETVVDAIVAILREEAAKAS